MNKISFKQDILPHLIAVFVFLVITILFFKPVFFEGKNLFQYDVLQGKASGQELVEYREQSGEEGLWTNSMFSGMPSYLINTRYSGDLIKYLGDAITLGLPGASKLIFLALIGYYILLLSFRVRPYLALAGAIAFGLTTFTLISLDAGHNSKVRAIALMPWVMAGIHLTFRRKYIAGFLLTAFAMYSQFHSNHLQITYYLLLIVLIYGLVQLIEAVKARETASFFKKIIILSLAVILAIGANLGRLWTLIEYGKYSIRGGTELTSTAEKTEGLEKEYAFRWSSGKLETMTLLIPNFYGGASQQKLDEGSELEKAMKARQVPRNQIKQYTDNAPTYWGDQPGTAGPIYAGALVCFLFVLGLFFAEKKYVIWLVAVAILSLMLAWGKNFETFNYLMFDYFPGYNKFRAVSMALTMILFALPLLGFIGLENFIKKGLTPETKKNFFISVGITAGICLIYYVFAGMMSFKGTVDSQMPAWFSKALQADRLDMGRDDALRSVFFILAGAAAIYFWLDRKLSGTIASFTLALLMLLDLGFVGARYLNNDDFQRSPERAFFAPTEADRVIKQDKSLHYRVYNLQNPFNDARTSYHHHSIGGYHGAKMRRYQDLIERAITPETNKLISDLQSQQFNPESYHVLNMLNTKYIMAGSKRQDVIQNPAALGNIWFVGQVKKVNSPDEEISAIQKIDTRKTAVIDASKFEVPQTSYSTQAQGQLTEYAPGHLKYSVNAQDKVLAVFSEVYYPKGWHVMIDGKGAKIMRANYVLRAMEIPAGEHIIEFNFQPKSYSVGNTVMLICSILFYIALIGGLVFLFKQKSPEQNINAA